MPLVMEGGNDENAGFWPGLAVADCGPAAGEVTPGMLAPGGSCGKVMLIGAAAPDPPDLPPTIYST